MARLLFIIFVLSFITFLSKAQGRFISVKGVEGECHIHNDLSLADAKERALLEAKLNALRKAGVPEVFSSFESVFSTIKGQEYTGFTNIEISGGISDFKIVQTKIEERVEGVFAKVKIDANVILYNTVRDPDFNLEIQGVFPSYTEGQSLVFQARATKDGYLKIFYLEDDNKVSLFYPNSFEVNRILQKDKDITFPTNSSINYRVTKQSNKVSERNTLIFVFTKTDIPCSVELINYHSVLNWIARITPEQRIEKYVVYTVYPQATR